MITITYSIDGQQFQSHDWEYEPTKAILIDYIMKGAMSPTEGGATWTWEDGAITVPYSAILEHGGFRNYLVDTLTM